MKKTMILLGAILTMGISISSYAEGQHGSMKGMKHHAMMQASEANADERISLHLAPQMKQHQLANMRSHLEAVHDIIGMLANNQFNEASKVAHNKLGLTPKMKKMCNMFANDDFKNFGLAFHKSADELGNVLKTGDMKLSLIALHKTMNSCVQCHATFRQ